MFSYAINDEQLLINPALIEKSYLCKYWLGQTNALLHNGTFNEVQNFVTVVNVLISRTR